MRMHMSQERDYQDYEYYDDPYPSDSGPSIRKILTIFIVIFVIFLLLYIYINSGYEFNLNSWNNDNLSTNEESIENTVPNPKPVVLDDAIWNFDEGQGNMVYSTNYRNIGEIIGARWVEGLSKTALEFTVEAWIKLTEDPVKTGCILSKESTSTSEEGYGIYISTNRTLSLSVGDVNERYCIYGNSLSLNKWYHIICLWDDSVIYIYQDGNLVSAKKVDIEIADSGNVLYMGNNYLSDHGFAGIIDEVTFYNYGLDRLSIMEHYLEFG